MDPADPFLLLVAFGAALAAGAGNAVAGGGTNLSFPVLIWLGVPPVAANATNGVGLWPGSIGAAVSYRERIAETPGRWWWLLIPSVLGGAVGAWLLLALPADWFETLAPWLVIGASGMVAGEPLVRDRLASHALFREEAPEGAGGGWLAIAVVGQFVIAVYGGYFGAGMGILILSSLALLGMHDLQSANGFKNLVATAIKTVAVVYFGVKGAVLWPVALVMAVGSTLGGYTAGFLVQKVSGGTLRWMVVTIGVGMGVVLLLQG